MIALGGYFLNYYRSENKTDANRCFITLGSLMLLLSTYFRPDVLYSSSEVFNKKIDLLPIILFGMIVKYIWRDKGKAASNAVFGIHLTAFVFLIADALMNQTLANTLIVLITALTIMLISFAARSGRWFGCSAAAFGGITLYITRDFLSSIAWWVYLLAAGIILITAAAGNEYLKSQGKTIKSVTEKITNHWKK